MRNSLIHAFFVGRAAAEVISEQVEDTLTNALSELGKFDAEQRSRLHQFTEEVLARAEREARNYTSSPGTTPVNVSSPNEDLQETIDEMRADIARLRAEIKVYRTKAI